MPAPLRLQSRCHSGACPSPATTRSPVTRGCSQGRRHPLPSHRLARGSRAHLAQQTWILPIRGRHSEGTSWASPGGQVGGPPSFLLWPREPPLGMQGRPSEPGGSHVHETHSARAPRKPGPGPALGQLCRVFGQLDGMFCRESRPWIPELRFQEGGRRGCWLLEEAQEVIVGLEPPFPPHPTPPGLTRTTAHPALAWWGAGVRPRPLGEGQDREGGGSRMVSEIRFGQSSEVRPRGQSGLREGTVWAQGGARPRTAFWSHNSGLAHLPHLPFYRW